MSEDWTNAVVVRTERPQDELVRLVLRVNGWWSGTGKADEAVRLAVSEAAGHWSPARWYSLRRVDPGQTATEVWIDVVQHAGGIVADWSRGAAPGDRVRWNGLHGWFEPPADARTFLLVADAPGAPAAERIREELPAGASARTVLARDGDLADVVRAELAERPVDFVWIATASAPARACRSLLRHELRRPATTWSAMAYWIPERERYERALRRAGIDTAAVYEGAQAEGLDEEQAIDRVEALLAARGL